jgi:hypothetical protein
LDKRQEVIGALYVLDYVRGDDEVGLECGWLREIEIDPRVARILFSEPLTGWRNVEPDGRTIVKIAK